MEEEEATVERQWNNAVDGLTSESRSWLLVEWPWRTSSRGKPNKTKKIMRRREKRRHEQWGHIDFDGQEILQLDARQANLRGGEGKQKTHEEIATELRKGRSRNPRGVQGQKNYTGINRRTGMGSRFNCLKEPRPHRDRESGEVGSVKLPCYQI